MSVVGRWLSERIPISALELREITNEPVPNHLRRWWFALGGTPAYLFVVQIFTGILLAFHYQAAPETAYQSIRFITQDVDFGWYLRSMHKWSATFMIAAVILHQMRVYFTAAYRRPREINWMIGMTLLMCTLLTGFTGYSLAFEQLSYWGATVAGNIADAVPLVGPLGKRILLGGDSYNENTLSRIYVLHAAVFPATIILLLVVHILFIRLQGVTEYRFEDEPEPGGHFDFFPDHMATELAVGLVLMIILSVLATVFPATMGPRANALMTPEVIKPEWYFYVAFRWLKLFSLTAAVISTGLIVCAMFVWPFIDNGLRRLTKNDDIHIYIGIVATCLLVGLTIWEAVVAH